VAIRRPLGDLYEELGVARDASREEIAAAYRARAKELHPDTRPVDADAASRFARVGTAYRVLSDPSERARYDETLRRLPPSTPSTPVSPARPAAPPAKPRRLTRKGARWCAWGGAVLAVLGFVVGAFVFALERHDADLRAHGIATTAVVVPGNAERRLQFETADGRVVRARESVKTGEEAPALGSRIRIHYDPHDPTNIVTDESHTGRDITLWIVAVKFVLGGAVLMWFGIRALRRMAPR
jgi:curved DNA-binding protein CbpA